MTYRLTFLQDAQKEWNKLNPSVRQQFKKKLIERLQHPHIPASKLFAMKHCYKIKLRSSGYRLVYRVFDDRIVVQEVAVGKREGNEVYETAKRRLDTSDE